MKIRVHYMVVIIAVGILSPIGVHVVRAQDGNYPIPESYDDVDPERDRVIYAPGEGDPLLTNKTQVAPSRDTASARTTPVVRPVSAPGETTRSNAAPAKAQSTEDDSVLSFNFLYYLFEKYKLQDIVD